MNKNCLETFKIIVVGNQDTGKTTFVKRWLGEPFVKKYKTTIVSEFGSKIFPSKSEQNETTIKRGIRIQIWDLGGQDRNKYLTSLFCRDLHGALILADATNEVSLQECAKWKDAITDNIGVCDNKNLPIYLIQNKCDLLDDEQQEVQLNKVKNYAEQNNFTKYYLTSAKTYYNIKEAMISIIEDIDKCKVDTSFLEVKSHNSHRLEQIIQKEDNEKCQC